MHLDIKKNLLIVITRCHYTLDAD